MPAARADTEAARAHATGARLRQLRRAKRLTQREVAATVPMSPGNLSRIENGEQGPPADETIVRLAAALDADAAELLRLAGRQVPAGPAFEEAVMGELHELRAEVQQGFARLAAALERSTP